ncbi:MAG: cell division protein ZapA [Candidatus Zixiibacteriota bacterium]|jgi:cell division protein ZapA
MTASKQTTKVTIFGVEYSITSDRNPEEVRRIAKFVDDKMWEISENNNLISTEKVAILTALNIAEDFLHTLEQRKKEKERVEKKTSSIIKLIDESRL